MHSAIKLSFMHNTMNVMKTNLVLDFDFLCIAIIILRISLKALRVVELIKCINLKHKNNCLFLLISICFADYV